MKKLLGAVLLFLILNISCIFLIHIQAGFGDTKRQVHSVTKVLDSYAEPNSNPKHLIHAENQCRFWDSDFCSIAEARRQSFRLFYTNAIQVDDTARLSPHYQRYLASREALMKSGFQYILFLEGKPSDVDFVKKSVQYERESEAHIYDLVYSLSSLREEQIHQIKSRERYLFLVLYFINVGMAIGLLCYVLPWERYKVKSS